MVNTVSDLGERYEALQEAFDTLLEEVAGDGQSDPEERASLARIDGKLQRLNALSDSDSDAGENAFSAGTADHRAELRQRMAQLRGDLGSLGDDLRSLLSEATAGES